MQIKEQPQRSVSAIISSQQKQIGILPVRTPSISSRSKQIDPFLQLDHIGPVHIGPGEEQETSELPKKGFELLTYLLEGCMEHMDSQGNFRVLNPGDIQLLTAGKGILHKESCKELLSQKDFHAVDIWINLPGTKKLSKPAYQHISTFQLPVISLDNVIMKVLAGEWNGESSPVITGVPLLIMHLMLEAGAETQVAIPATFQSSIYVIKGYGLFGKEQIDAEEGNLVVFNIEEKIIHIKAPASKPLEALLLSGEPIRESIATYGPFVMNSLDDVYEAMIDYSCGGMESTTLLDPHEP